MNYRYAIAFSMIVAASYAAAQPNSDERYLNISKPAKAAQTAKDEPVKHTRRHYRERHSKRTYEAPPKITKHPTIDDPRKPLKESMNLPLVPISKSPDLTDMLKPKSITTTRIFPEPVKVASVEETIPVPTQPRDDPKPEPKPAPPPPQLISNLPPAGEIIIAGGFGIVILAGFAGLWHYVRETAKRLKLDYAKPSIQPRRTKDARYIAPWWQLHHRLDYAIKRQREQRSLRRANKRLEYARSQLRASRPASPTRPRGHDRHFRPMDDYPSVDSPLGSYCTNFRSEAREPSGKSYDWARGGIVYQAKRG